MPDILEAIDIAKAEGTMPPIETPTDENTFFTLPDFRPYELSFDQESTMIEFDKVHDPKHCHEIHNG